MTASNVTGSHTTTALELCVQLGAGPPNQKDAKELPHACRASSAEFQTSVQIEIGPTVYSLDGFEANREAYSVFVKVDYVQYVRESNRISTACRIVAVAKSS